MPVLGGAAVLVTNAELARRSRHRPVWVKGFGERVPYKTPTYAADLLQTPMIRAAESAFSMANLGPSDMDMVSIYDCYTITALLSLEDAGFCEKGTGLQFVANHDLTFRGDFPMNTAGGQLGYGQAGTAGGMHHVCDATRQIMGRGDETQADDLEWREISGAGSLYTFTVSNRPVSPHFVDDVPQILAIVQWDEGPRFSTEIVNAAPEAIRVGMRVRPVFTDYPDTGVTMLRYEPAE